jgi:hypothetical protein
MALLVARRAPIGASFHKADAILCWEMRTGAGKRQVALQRQTLFGYPAIYEEECSSASSSTSAASILTGVSSHLRLPVYGPSPGISLEIMRNVRKSKVSVPIFQPL